MRQLSGELQNTMGTMKRLTRALEEAKVAVEQIRRRMKELEYELAVEARPWC